MQKWARGAASQEYAPAEEDKPVASRRRPAGLRQSCNTPRACVPRSGGEIKRWNSATVAPRIRSPLAGQIPARIVNLTDEYKNSPPDLAAPSTFHIFDARY
jgi:hypothetical protein